MNEAREQMRCRVYRRVDAERGAFVGCSRKEVDERVALVVPELGNLRPSANSLVLRLGYASTYLFSAQQRRQIIWYLALESNNPRGRLLLRRCTRCGKIDPAAAKKIALPPQLLQISLRSRVSTRSTRSASTA
jgi:hypothetical protein